MRDEKKLLMNEIKDKIDSSTAMVVASYVKLPPNAAWGLRDNLAKLGSHFEVVRKRIFLKAAELSGIKIEESLLKGHIGVMFVNQPDAMAPAKLLGKFSEENANTLVFLCGLIDGKMMPGAEVDMLSRLPGIDEMRAQFLALLVSPMSQMLAVVEAALEQKNKTE